MSNLASIKEGSVSKQFLEYILPSILATMVSGLYQIVDGLFIGQFVGSDGLAAINLAWPIIGTLYGVGLMIGIGSGAISSIAKGRKQYSELHMILSNAMALLCVFGALAGLIVFFGKGWLLSLQGKIESQVFQHSIDYLQVLSIGAPVAMASIALPVMIRNEEAPKIATKLIIIGAIANIILDALFIAYFKMGLHGAAIATTLSQLIVSVLGIKYFFSKRSNMKLSLSGLSINIDMVKHICSVGFSSFMVFSYFSFLSAVHNYLFLSYNSTTHVAAFGVLGSISALYFIFSDGVAIGSQPLMSYCFGAQDYRKMKQFFIMMVKWIMGIGVLYMVILNLFSQIIIKAFNHTDIQFLKTATFGLRAHLSGIFLDGFIFAVGAFFQSIGSSKKANLITFANMLVQIPFLFLFSRFMGVDGVWFAVPVSNVVLSIAAFYMMWREWRKLSMSKL